jgi:hypothetical protein
MHKLLFVVGLAAVVTPLGAGCGKKNESGDQAKKEIEPPVEKVEITQAQIDAVKAQQSRLDELGVMLDKVDAVTTPIEIANQFRQLEEWKGLVGKFSQLQTVDALVGELDNAVKTLRTFRAGLDQTEVRLGNLASELDKWMKESGTGAKLSEVRAKVSADVRAAIEPFAQQTGDVIANALQPLVEKLEKVEGLLEVGCGGLKLSGASDAAKKQCDSAKTAFIAGKTFVAGLKDRPVQLFNDVSNGIETALVTLYDEATKQAIEAAQQQVNELLKLPTAEAPAGSGSAAGSAAGSASK